MYYRLISCRHFSTPAFHEKFKFHYRSNKYSSDLELKDNINETKNKNGKTSYHHMYKHLPIKSFQKQFKNYIEK